MIFVALLALSLQQKHRLCGAVPRDETAVRCRPMGQDCVVLSNGTGLCGAVPRDKCRGSLSTRSDRRSRRE